MRHLWLFASLLATTASFQVHYAIQNHATQSYLYVINPPTPDSKVAVLAASQEHILQNASAPNMRFLIAWNDAGFATITCVANNLSLTASVGIPVDRFTSAPVMGSPLIEDASFWALDSVSWDPEQRETMFVVNQLYVDFMFVMAGEAGEVERVLTTRHVKHFGMKKTRWIIDVILDDDDEEFMRARLKGAVGQTAMNY